MALTEKSCTEFAEVLAGRDPVPGGGGASALAGALGIALGNMVGNLTAGKKKYASFEEDLRRLMKEAEGLRKDFLSLVEGDAEAFSPFVDAYSLPSDTPERKALRDKALEAALEGASLVPFEVMEKCGAALDLLAAFAEKGSPLAVSDAGIGACLCRAALAGASLSVYANTRLMSDRNRARELNLRVESLLARYEPMAEGILRRVRDILGAGVPERGGR